MKMQELLDRIEEIRRVAEDEHDDEQAHGLEDKLWEDVFEAIARPGCRLRAVFAAQALKTRDIEFARWSA